MVRDTLAEIAEIKARSGYALPRHSSEMSELVAGWDAGRFEAAPEYVLVRLVTILEVFTRSWVAEIVDSGEPYISRAAGLAKNGVKIDYAVAQALAGQRVTLGELISHALSVSSIESINHCFATLIGEDIFSLIDGVCDRWLVEWQGQPAKPIIENMDFVRSSIAELFKVRHIVVHELPFSLHLLAEDISAFVRATSEFVEASDQALTTLLRGNYPLTQFEINMAAGDAAREADEELAGVLRRLDPSNEDKELQAVQAAWGEYRMLEADYRSGANQPGRGTIASLIHATVFKELTRDRITHLTAYLERSEGEF